MCGLMRTPGSRHSGWPAGSGSGSVTSSAAAIRPGGHLGDEGVGVDDAAPCDVHEQRAVRHRGEEGRVDEPARGVVERHDEDDDVVVGQQRREGVDAVDVPAGVVPAPGSATRVRCTSNGANRSTTALPTLPVPMTSTRRSASAGR